MSFDEAVVKVIVFQSLSAFRDFCNNLPLPPSISPRFGWFRGLASSSGAFGSMTTSTGTKPAGNDGIPLTLDGNIQFKGYFSFDRLVEQALLPFGRHNVLIFQMSI